MMNVNHMPQTEEVYDVGYVDKATCSDLQVWPVPEDLENWYEVAFDESFDYTGKVYNPAKNEWEEVVESTEAYNERMLVARRKAYVDTDKLFMEWQFDQTVEARSAWEEAVAKVKAEYPFK